jgi:hypothetical protein
MGIGWTFVLSLLGGVGIIYAFTFHPALGLVALLLGIIALGAALRGRTRRSSTATTPATSGSGSPPTGTPGTGGNPVPRGVPASPVPAWSIALGGIILVAMIAGIIWLVVSLFSWGNKTINGPSTPPATQNRATTRPAGSRTAQPAPVTNTEELGELVWEGTVAPKQNATTFTATVPDTDTIRCLVKGIKGKVIYRFLRPGALSPRWSSEYLQDGQMITVVTDNNTIKAGTKVTLQLAVPIQDGVKQSLQVFRLP